MSTRTIYNALMRAFEQTMRRTWRTNFPWWVDAYARHRRQVDVFRARLDAMEAAGINTEPPDWMQDDALYAYIESDRFSAEGPPPYVPRGPRP